MHQFLSCDIVLTMFMDRLSGLDALGMRIHQCCCSHIWAIHLWNYTWHKYVQKDCRFYEKHDTWHDLTQHDMTRLDMTRLDTTQHDMTTQHKSTRIKTNWHDTQHNWTRHDTQQHNLTQHDTTHNNTTWLDTTQHTTTKNWSILYNFV